MFFFKSRKNSDLSCTDSSVNNSAASNLSIASCTKSNAMYHPSLKNLEVTHPISYPPVYACGNNFLNVFHNNIPIKAENSKYIYNSVYYNNVNAGITTPNYYIPYPNICYPQSYYVNQVSGEPLHPEKVCLSQKMEKVVSGFGGAIPSNRIFHKIVEIPQYQYREVEINKAVEVPKVQTQVVVEKVSSPIKVNVPMPQPRQLQIHQTVARNVPSPVHVLTTQNYKIPKLKIEYVNVSVPVYLPHYIEVPVAANFLLVDNLSEGIDKCSLKKTKDKEDEEMLCFSEQINEKENENDQINFNSELLNDKNSKGLMEFVLKNNDSLNTKLTNSKPPSIIEASKDSLQVCSTNEALDENEDRTTKTYSKTIDNETTKVEDLKKSVCDKSSNENLNEMLNNNSNNINISRKISRDSF